MMNSIIKAMDHTYIDVLQVSKVKPRTFWSELKSLLLNDTHYRDYLPLMTETEKQKVVRIYNDTSFISSHTTSDYWAFLPKAEPWDPSRKLLIAWIFLMFVVNTYYFYEATIILTFGNSVWNGQMHLKGTVAINWIFLIVYLCDMVINLNSGYYVDGILILDRKRILSRYIKSLMIVDLLAILVIFLTLVMSSFEVSYAKMFLLIKLFGMKSLDYIIQRKLQIHRYWKAAYLICRILWIVMLISNFIGLIFYSIDYYILTNGIYQPDFCWLSSSTAFSNIIGESWEVQYVYSIYWGVNTITTISYGDIAPNNPIEVVYSLVCFVIAFVIYSYVLNQIVQTVLWAKQIRENYRNELVIINTFMRRKDISQELQNRTTEYLEFLYEEESLRDQSLEREMIQRLPERLRMVLLKDAFKLFYLRLTETFSRFPDQCISQLLTLIIETKVSNNEVIFEKGDANNQSLFMIFKGKVNLLISYGKGNHKEYFLQEVHTQSKTFGQLEFVTGGSRRYKAVSEDVTSLYYVQRKSLLDVMSKSCKCNEYFSHLLSEIEISQKYYLINYYCQKCEGNHLFEQCDQLFPQFKNNFTFKSNESQPELSLSLDRPSIRRRRSIHPAYRSKREAANEMEKYAPKLQIEQVVRFKLERRMALIQMHINETKQRMEVDTYQDWEYYNSNCNPSVVFRMINKVP